MINTAPKNNILIVEDEILIAMHIKQCLEKEKLAKATIAKNYNDAIAHLKSTQTFDMVFLDVNISDTKTGIDLANYINENHGIPFLFITSYTDPKTLAELQETMPEAYISKPFNNADIIATFHILSNKLKSSKIFKLKIGKTLYNINLENLIYAESDHVYIHLIFTNKNLVIRSSIGSLLNSLPIKSLVQINRSIAVNPKFVTHSDAKIVAIGKTEFTKSPNYSFP